jgi:hypothetical protein
MADRAAGALPAGYVTVVLADSNGKETRRVYETKSTVGSSEVIVLADALQAITQLEVVDVLWTVRETGFTPITVEANSSTAETASVSAQLADGRNFSFNLPALKAAMKIGKTVDGTNATLMSFLENFDDGAGVAAVPGSFYVSDGQEISEVFHEADLVTGIVN